jgi:hypothetical protein
VLSIQIIEKIWIEYRFGHNTGMNDWATVTERLIRIIEYQRKILQRSNLFESVTAGLSRTGFARQINDWLTAVNDLITIEHTNACKIFADHLACWFTVWLFCGLTLFTHLMVSGFTGRLFRVTRRNQVLRMPTGWYTARTNLWWF